MKSLKAGILVLAAIAFSTAVGNASNGPETKTPPMGQKAPVMEWAMPTVVTDFVIVKAADHYCPEVPADETPNQTVKFYLDLCARLTQANDRLTFTPQWCYRQFARPPSYSCNKAYFIPNRYLHKTYTRQLTC